MNTYVVVLHEMELHNFHKNPNIIFFVEKSVLKFSFYLELIYKYLNWLKYRFCHIICILIHSTVLTEHLICSWNSKIAKLNMTISYWCCRLVRSMVGWMSCDFTSFSTVFSHISTLDG